ncbi:hypothetical protein C2G38_745943 [Gigaspora rosea]|uniref:Uncharacterized protein n=1 Tax=Gigaspora rosea TaxID=44941 RepID=A0A397U4T9_9GLOM|nr:hypothetical protein C2G38_745943 [Gigaspora rosea]
MIFLLINDDEAEQVFAEVKKKRTFKKFSYRGIDQLLDLNSEQLTDLVHARARRFQRELKRKPMGLIKKLRKAKKEAINQQSL